jgi:hypothetical protein
MVPTRHCTHIPCAGPGAVSHTAAAGSWPMQPELVVHGWHVRLMQAGLAGDVQSVLDRHSTHWPPWFTSHIGCAGSTSRHAVRPPRHDDTHCPDALQKGVEASMLRQVVAVEPNAGELHGWHAPWLGPVVTQKGLATSSCVQAVTGPLTHDWHCPLEELQYGKTAFLASHCVLALHATQVPAAQMGSEVQSVLDRH